MYIYIGHDVAYSRGRDVGYFPNLGQLACLLLTGGMKMIIRLRGKVKSANAKSDTGNEIDIRP